MGETERMVLTLILKPIMLIIFFIGVFYIRQIILFFIPEGRVKRILTKQIN